MSVAWKIFITLICGVATMSLLLGIYYLNIPNVRENIGAPKQIDVRIRLQNKCSIIDEAFIVEAPEQRRTSQFQNGVALLRLPQHAKVKLSISPAFPDFIYDGVLETVAPNMVLIADCSVSPRLKSIFSSMKERFSN